MNTEFTLGFCNDITNILGIISNSIFFNFLVQRWSKCHYAMNGQYQTISNIDHIVL